MNDFTILEIEIFFQSSQDPIYRQSVIDGYVAFANFLQTHGLTVREVLRPGDTPTIESQIMRSDLTDEGLEFVKRALDKWLRARDKGQSPKDVGILEKELKKLRTPK